MKLINETTETQSLLLDSSLISAYKNNLKPCSERVLYDCKVIRCGDYLQVYFFDNIKSKSNEDLKEKSFNIKSVDTDNLYKVASNEPKQILLSNAIRSNLACQRIAKTNRNEWESFITLTFKENITNIAEANKIFHSWVTNIRKLKNNFKYLAVPEFQKRGAVHYHILSNLGLEDKNVILEQKIKKGKAENCDTLYDVKFWSKGFVRVDFIKGDYKKIYSYICKYMTKDIDNKLFGKKRYFYSQNLQKPTTEFLNLSDTKHLEYFKNLIKDNNLEYESIYEDNYTKQKIQFREFLNE